MDDLRSGARPLDEIVDRVGDARFVLLGEASHGTHEFYVDARAADQFDLLAHVDETTALEPLDRWSALEEPAETYPSGL